jgi:hypothetical protein
MEKKVPSPVVFLFLCLNDSSVFDSFVMVSLMSDFDTSFSPKNDTIVSPNFFDDLRFFMEMASGDRLKSLMTVFEDST